MDEQREAASPVTIFYSYAHEDEPLRDQLEKHLSILRRQGVISEWYDRQIVAGTDWAYAVHEHLKTASVILLLISPDFLASDYCYSIEMQQALERHKVDEARVIPVILRSVDWQGAPFAHLQCLPRDGKPVTTWADRDEAFVDVARGIRTAVEELRASSGTVQPPSLPPRTISLPPDRRRANVSAPPGDSNRQRMLARVSMVWIKGLLEPSLHGAALMTLGLDEQSDLIANPWRLAVQELDHPTRSLPPGTRITQVYDDAGGELLILGEPGSGKTTLLLELARDLLDRAQQDDTLPMPVVFNLSSWTEKQQSITDWLVEELNTKYQVPRKLAQSWLDADQVLPLFDGLDEVSTEHRAACIDAINTYRQLHGLVPTVVCSRSAEYLAQQRRIELHSAVVVQPLTAQQVDEYLASAGEQLASVRLVLRDDPVLRELAATPLILSVLTLAYHGRTIEDGLLAGSAPEIRRQVFATYVQRMLQRRGRETRYTREQTMHWLAWLARQLAQHSQTEFYIERMQPNWLSASQLHWLYELLAIQLPDMLIGTCVSLVFVSMFFSTALGGFEVLHYGILGGLTGWLISRGGQPAKNSIHFWSSFWRNLFNFRSLGTGLIIGLSFGLIYGRNSGLNYGLAYGLSFGLVSDLLSATLAVRISARSPAKSTVWSWGNLWYTLVKFGYLGIGLTIGLSYALAYVLSTELANQLLSKQQNVLAYALAYVLNYTLVGILLCIILERRRPGIQPAEIVIWSWRSLWQSLISIRHLSNALVVGLLIGVMVGLSAWLRVSLHFGLNYGLNAALIFGLSYWLFLGLFKGLSNDTLDEHHRITPNEGIRRSARNSLLVGLISGLVSWFICTLSYTLSYSVTDSLNTGLGFGLNTGSSVGLVVGLSVGLIVGLQSGGLACVQHCILRLLLWHTGSIPWKYPLFLDYADRHILLRKVGGGYTFIHRLLLDYFASLSDPSTSRTVPMVRT